MKWFIGVMVAAALSLSGATVCKDTLGNAPRDLSGLPMGWRHYDTVIQGSSGTRQIMNIQGRPAVVLKDEGPGEIGFFREFPCNGERYWHASIYAALPKGAKANDAAVLQLTFMGKTRKSAAVRLDVSSQKFEKFDLYMQAPAGATSVRCYIYTHKPPTGSVAVRDLMIETSAKPFAAAYSPSGMFFQAGQGKLNLKNVQATPMGVIIREGGKSYVGAAGAEPDLVFDIAAGKPGLYVISTESCVDKVGAAKMLKSRTKYDSMAAQFQIDDARPTQRYIFVPWSRPDFCRQTPGKFYLSGKPQKLKIWLPEHCALKTVRIVPYVSRAVPRDAANYTPRYVPPKTRPRLWVNADTVEKVRANLTHPEHAHYWAKVKAVALAPAKYTFDPGKEMKHNSALESVMYNKAFYYLMTGDKKIGLEAVSLARKYLELVEFGNLLDITREMGRAIHYAACVYDWCYDLMTPEDKASLCKNFMRLAIDMECGWPPFGQSIVNGHGNELQINRDFLSMSIAIYDEDPVPYKYCSYLILEQLVPMRKFEYRSPRHNQGVGYASFRFPCDLRAATLFRQMLGFPVFDENIKTVPLYWIYMRTPSGSMFPDGDGGMGQQSRYWSSPDSAFMNMIYTGSPLVKGEFNRQVPGMYWDSPLFLLLNDPGLKAESSLASLPLTLDFGPTLSGMIARTGWRIGPYSDDVSMEIKGGGYHFGNHQHADAGAFQIFYRGNLVTRLGQYHYYGTPYDMNFGKRSIANSMVLVRDPKERFLNTPANDGGSLFYQSHPKTPEQARRSFRYGKKLYCSFGPSAMRPYYSSYAADLTGAYSKKVKKFVRTFHFFNMENTEIPAVIIATDNITSSDPAFRKYWQLATLSKPVVTADGVVLSAGNGRKTGKLHVSMPLPAEKTVEVKSGKDLHDVFGLKYNPPQPGAVQAKGHRVMFSPAKASANDRFLTIMQVADQDAKPLPVKWSETPVSYVVEFGNRAVSLNSGTEMIGKAFSMNVTRKGNVQILAAGLADGLWTVTGPAGKFYTEVKAGKNTIFLMGPAGKYTFAPGKSAGAKALPDYSGLAPAKRPEPPANSLIHDGRAVKGVQLVSAGRQQFLASAIPLLKALGAEDISAKEGFLKARVKDASVVFYLESGDVTVNGAKVVFPEKTRVIKGEWYMPLSALVLFGLEAEEDRINRSVELRLRPAEFENILWISSRANNNRDQLWEMLRNGNGKAGYWDGEGDGAGFELGFVRPVEIDGVAIQFYMGAARKAKFDIEVSNGGPWKKVFSGVSSGKTEDLEYFRFPAEKVSKIRFVGYGNTINQWNSITTFKVLEKK
ncbi:MAG: hypothetical protein IJV89_09310 [Lentisphaeria bacterium]|nr:hypothetical protein [Lentisphaeria bacterium]